MSESVVTLSVTVGVEDAQCQQDISLTKINIIEGPDGSGKTTFVKSLVEATKSHGLTVKYLRFPDDRHTLTVRTQLMSQELVRNPGASMFLFLADFIHAFEADIEPHLNDDNVIFILDRFIPSTCVYQKAPISYIDSILKRQFRSFSDAFSHARYFYLDAPSLDELKRRLSKKKGDELNTRDPETDQQILNQILSYRDLALEQKHFGLLGSKDVVTLTI